MGTINNSDTLIAKPELQGKNKKEKGYNPMTLLPFRRTYLILKLSPIEDPDACLSVIVKLTEIFYVKLMSKWLIVFMAPSVVIVNH